MKSGAQFYLLGPNVQQVSPDLADRYRCYFYPTTFTTVVAEHVDVPRIGDRQRRLVEICRTLDEPSLIYCRSPRQANEIAKILLIGDVGVRAADLDPAVDWIGSAYHPEWILPNALRQAIAIHHGGLPRSIAHYVVRKFNELKIRFLICTSTLIEGVNTKAKNVIIYDNTIANQRIDYFTFNNIRGRAGRMFEHFVGRIYLFSEPPQLELPSVDFPLLSQSADVPDSLLVQLNDEDLTVAARERVRRLALQQDLPLDIIKGNSAVDPDSQVGLARELATNIATLHPLLSWTGNPSWEQLRAACRLIWRYFVDRPADGVFSGDQLAFKIFQLRGNPSVSNRILEELRPGRYSAETVDDAVERVLRFDRQWAGHRVPQLLMTLSAIQAHVFQSRGLTSGDYRPFVAQVESLFRPPVIAALDEYGIPVQLGERLIGHLGAGNDLDIALSAIKRLDVVRLDLHPFEAELLVDARASI